MQIPDTILSIFNFPSILFSTMDSIKKKKKNTNFPRIYFEVPRHVL